MTAAPAARREGKGAVPWHSSLRFRLVAVAIAIELLMLGVLVSNSYRLVTDALESQTRFRLEALTPLLNASLAGYLFQRDHSEINGILKELVTSRMTDIRYIVVLDNRQRIVASIGPVDVAKVATLPIDTNVREALRDLVYDTRIDLTLPGNTLGSAHFGLSLVGMASLRDNVLRQSLMIAGIELLLSLLLLSFGGWLITRHLTQMLGATRAIARGDYGQLISIPGKDEIGVLAADFNVMTDAVQTRIADLHAAQEELRASESLLSRSQEIAHIGSWILNLTTNKLYWSDEVYRIFGCEPQEFAADYKVFLDFIHPNDRAAVNEVYSRSVGEGSDNYEIEHRIVRQGTGEIRHVHERCVHVRDAAGAIIQSIGMVQDITARKQAEESLAESEELYRVLVNTIPLGIMLIDQDHRIVKINDAQAGLFQRPPEWFIGRHCYEVFENRAQLCPHCPGEVSLKTGEVAHAEARGARDDNCRIWVRLHTAPVKLPNGSIGLIEVVEEVSEQRELEAKTQQMARLSALGEMASGVAHEINNPVAGILSCAELLKDRLPAGDRCHEIAERITRESERIAKIVRSLLSIARPNQNNRESLAIGDCVDSVLSLSRNKLIKSDIDLRIDIPEGLPRIFAERQQVEQMLLNLLNNSHYALNKRFPDKHPDKLISITARNLAAMTGDFIRLEVYDQGTGVRAEQLGKVFDPFFTTKPAGEGTGLGMGLCHEIVRAHGGEIRLESEPGRFTRVTVELPVLP